MARRNCRLLLLLAAAVRAAVSIAADTVGSKSAFFGCANRHLLSRILAGAMGRVAICRAADGDLVCTARPGDPASPALGARRTPSRDRLFTRRVLACRAPRSTSSAQQI